VVLGFAIAPAGHRNVQPASTAIDPSHDEPTPSGAQEQPDTIGIPLENLPHGIGLHWIDLDALVARAQIPATAIHPARLLAFARGQSTLARVVRRNDLDR